MDVFVVVAVAVVDVILHSMKFGVVFNELTICVLIVA